MGRPRVEDDEEMDDFPAPVAKELQRALPEEEGKLTLDYILYSQEAVVSFKKYKGLVGAAANVLGRAMSEVDKYGMPTRKAVSVANRIMDRAYGLPAATVKYDGDVADVNSMLERVSRSVIPATLVENDFAKMLSLEPSTNANGTDAGSEQGSS